MMQLNISISGSSWSSDTKILSLGSFICRINVKSARRTESRGEETDINGCTDIDVIVLQQHECFPLYLLSNILALLSDDCK